MTTRDSSSQEAYAVPDRTALVSAIPQEPDADTLLTYSALVAPDPLQAGESGAITLVVSNPGSTVVTVRCIELTIPLGTTGKTLTRSITGVDLPVPAGWDAQVDADVIAFTPTAGTADVRGSGLTFQIAGFVVNGEVGTPIVTVRETAATRADPERERGARFEIPKFPQRFRVGELRATPRGVVSGGSTRLDWSGTAKDAVYILEYQPADEGPLVSETVESAGTWLAEHLTRKNAVYFTLIVRVRTPGQDAPLEVQRHAEVAISTLSLDLSCTPVTVPPNGLARVRWKSPNATSCTLDPGGVALANSGELWIVVTAAAPRVTVTANGPGDSFDQKQFTFTVDPSLTATESGYAITGAPGGPGEDMRCVPPDSFPAGPGQTGKDAILRGKIPPLDERGASRRVIPVTLSGGAGGRGGGSGWCKTGRHPREIWEVPGGPGGNGGDAGIDAEFDSSLPPARYIVTLVPGAGGPHGGAIRYFTPADGKPGTTYIRIARPLGAELD